MMNIYKRIKDTGRRALKRLLSIQGYEISRIGKSELFIRFYEDFKTGIELKNNGIMSLVFSKDRAMQLHAFLCSYFENIRNYSPMIVLYKASNDHHQVSYKKLETIFKKLPVVFIPEVNFREQLIEVIKNTEEERFVFYVDDEIFTHKFDYNILETVNPYYESLSFSRGRDMTFSMCTGKPNKLPHFTPLKNGLLEFNWNITTELTDWSFPIGLSGYMYARKEILSILQVISFKAPNSLEGQMQNFRRYFLKRKGICTENAVAVCVQANLVQSEGTSLTLESYTAGELLEKWNHGFQINYQEFYSKPMNITQEMHYSFILRDN